MEIELIREVVKYFSELNPDKADLIDEEQSGVNLLGIICLKDKDGNNLLRIKKDDIGTYRLKLKIEKQKQSKKLQAEKYNPQCFNASIIKVAYGLDPGYALALLQDTSQLIIYPALLRWKNSIIMREKISEVVVEEVHSDTKKKSDWIYSCWSCLRISYWRSRASRLYHFGTSSNSNFQLKITDFRRFTM